MTRCPTCGATYGADSKFCTKDGTRLVAVSATPAPAPAAAAPAAAAAGASNPLMVSAPRTTTAAGRGEPKPVAAYANLVGQVLDKRYKIERKLGEGGMSF